jgi:hypothetical protein
MLITLDYGNNSRIGTIRSQVPKSLKKDMEKVQRLNGNGLNSLRYSLVLPERVITLSFNYIHEINVFKVRCKIRGTSQINGEGSMVFRKWNVIL